MLPCKIIGGEAALSPHPTDMSTFTQFIDTDVIALRTAVYGEGFGSILLDDVECVGSEPELQLCRNNGVGSHDCGHSEDAVVICLRNNGT